MNVMHCFPPYLGIFLVSGIDSALAKYWHIFDTRDMDECAQRN